MKKAILIVPVVIVLIYLTVVAIYYFMYSGKLSKFCDGELIREVHASLSTWCPETYLNRPKDEYIDCDKRIISKEEIDTELFPGAAKKGYSLIIKWIWSGLGTKEDPYKDPTKGEIQGFISPSGAITYYDGRECDKCLGKLDSVSKTDLLSDARETENSINSYCRSINKSTIFSLGLKPTKKSGRSIWCGENQICGGFWMRGSSMTGNTRGLIKEGFFHLI